jgi:hypothetical protein
MLGYQRKVDSKNATAEVREEKTINFSVCEGGARACDAHDGRREDAYSTWFFCRIPLNESVSNSSSSGIISMMPVRLATRSPWFR